MKIFEKYAGYNLTRFFFDKEYTGFCIIITNVRGKCRILAYGDIVHLIAILGFTILDSMIIECKKDETNKTWFIEIDMDKEGRFS